MRAKVALPYLLVAVMAAGVVMPSAGIIHAPPAVAATSPDELLEDPELERRARELSKELRCLVCQNQSIDDSDADLARDLRALVRERLLEGDTDEEIIDFVTQRYGDFVLLRPPVKPTTWILWYGPPVLFLIAGAGLVLYVRRRRHAPISAPVDDLSEEEQAKLDRLLGRREADTT
ncbi:MAG: cytochrome c-type biogenesis protein [Pseudomonadota bacterium]